MGKPKRKKWTGILVAIAGIFLLGYVFFQDKRLAQIICLVSVLSFAALIQRWSVSNEKFGKLLGCMGLVFPAFVLPFLSELPLVTVIVVWLNRFCSWILGYLGMDKVVVISNKDWLQIIYWILFWVICGIVSLVKWVRRKEKVPQLKNQDYTDQLVSFAEALTEQMKTINREASWDAMTFTPIDAEVDATIHGRRKRKFGDLHRCINTYRDENSVFLVLGDPGSGKSVAMRKLALDMLQETEKSGVVPVYIDLKQWNKSWSINNRPDQKDLLEFILDCLKKTPALIDQGFLDNYFMLMLRNGRWFFIFDSFDELPCLLGREDDSELIKHISDLLYNFLSITSQCGGVIASRLFRGPRPDKAKFVSLRLQPFSDLKINTMLKRYRIYSDSLAERLFHNRNDLVALCRNPFSLSLLIDYLRQNISAELPENQLELYNSFLERRLERKAEKIREDGFQAEHVTAAASALALYLQNRPEKGLECTLSDLKKLNDGRDWDKLLNLLAEIRLCRYGGNRDTVSFVHRRFQEFFVVKDILDRNQQISPEEYQSIGRNKGIRDAMVLYCEVAPADKAREIAQYCWEEVQSKIAARGNISNPGCVELVNTLYFMAEAFRSRLDELQPFRLEFQTLLETNLDGETDYYVQHAIVSCMVLLEQEPMQRFALQVLKMGNRYLSDLVLLNCRAITERPSDLFNTEFTAYFASMRYAHFFGRFRNTDFSLSQLPQFRYIRNMHRLCMAAEISLLLYCLLVALYAPFIYVWEIGFYPDSVSLLCMMLFNFETMIIAVKALARFHDPLTWFLVFLCMSSCGEFSYTGFSRPLQFLQYVGVPVLLFQMVHITKSIWCGFRQKQYSENWILCVVVMAASVASMFPILLQEIPWYKVMMGKMAPYGVLLSFVGCMGLVLDDPIRYLRDKRWMKKHPNSFEKISRADLTEILRQLKSTKGSCQYLQMLCENGVTLHGEWPNGRRPIIDNGEIDQLLTRLDAASMDELSRHF